MHSTRIPALLCCILLGYGTPPASAGDPETAEITSPPLDAPLPGPTVTFTWNEIPAAVGYRLEVGSTEGGSEYWDSGVITETSETATGLPVDGSPLHVRLTTLFAGGQGAQFKDYSVSTYNLTLERPESFRVANIWDVASLNIPPRPAGLMFARDGNTLYVVGASETLNSALHAVPVTRDPATRRVIGLGQATRVFDGDPETAGLDAGWEFGPDNTLFYTYWDANKIGQRPGGLGGAETLFDMADLEIPSSVAGLTFSPHLDDVRTGFGMMQVSVWQGADILNIPLERMGGGLFQPLSKEVFVTLPRQGTGAIQYVPSGFFRGNLMYVNWDFGEVMMVVIDPRTGLPIDDATGLPHLGTDNPRVIRFASNLGVGPWGLEFDPFTNDFFVSTWDGEPEDSIIHFSGVGLPAPGEETRVLEVEITDGRFSLEWEAPVGWEQVVEFSTDMRNWSVLLVVPSAPGFNRRNFELPVEGVGFVRIRATRVDP